MKISFRILALKLLVLIFWSMAFSGISWSSSKNYPQTEMNQVNQEDSLSNKLYNPNNDSLAKILCDKKPPYFILINPVPEQKQVDWKPTIKFRVVDENVTKGNWDKSGVDINKIFVSITSRFWDTPSIKPDSIKLIDSIFVVECTYCPRDSFDWSDTVKVKLDAWDVSYFRNHADTSYTFYTIRDTIAPVLTPIYPLPGDQDVPLSSTVIIQGTEIGRGVVRDSIKFWINNLLIKPDSIPGDPWNFRIYYYSDTSWYFDKDIDVVCTAYDLDRNADTLIYSFNTESPPDTSGPWFIDLIPSPGDTGVPRETSIQFTVVDDYLGVDVDSVFISITSRMKPKKKVRVDNFQIIDPCTVRFFYQPPQAFDWNDTARVELLAYDLSTPAKPGSTFYDFYTITDRKPPVIEVIRPKPDTTNVPIDTDIVLYVTDDSSGVDTASVVFKVNDQVINLSDTNFVYDGVGDTVHYKPSSPFDYLSEVKVYFYVADLAGNPADTLYSFWTEPGPDTTAPWFIDLVPDSLQTGVDTTASIKFTVVDDFSGVDHSSVKISVTTRKWQKVDETPKVLEVVSKDTIRFEYDPPQNFDLNDTVRVKLIASDLADPANRSSLSYWFVTDTSHIDKITPWFIDLVPDSLQTGVDTTASIKFTVVDDFSGVDHSSVKISVTTRKWQKVDETPKVLEVVSKDTIRFEYDPPQNFDLNDTVRVKLIASDLADPANTGSLSYWFVVADSIKEGPIVYDHNPDIYGSIDTLDYSIQFKVRDESGVNVLSIVVGIRINDGPTQFLDSTRRVSVTGDTIDVESELLHFNYNDSVFVDIYAEDNAGNSTDTDSTTHYYFTVLEDLEPPQIVFIDPTQLTGLQDSFLVRIEDNLSGINLEKCEMYLWSRKRPDQQKIDIPSFIKSNENNKVDFEYYPADPYEYNDSLSLKFFLQDNCGNSTTVTLLDTIYTPKILPDLFVLNFISSAGEEPVPLNTIVSLEAYIICVNEDCPDSFAVCFYFDEAEVPFHTAWIKGLTNEEVHLLNTSHEITSEGPHKVTVIVDCIPTEGRVTEENEFNNTAEVIIIGGGAKLIVRSNPFTPNDDGCNDEAVFNFEQFCVENPNLKIFDLHGNKVKDFDKPNNKRFVWNGLDSSGKHLLPGIYLYLFLDRDKVVARGCIVIVR
jgi:hypothetical protein